MNRWIIKGNSIILLFEGETQTVEILEIETCMRNKGYKTSVNQGITTKTMRNKRGNRVTFRSLQKEIEVLEGIQLFFLRRIWEFRRRDCAYDWELRIKGNRIMFFTLWKLRVFQDEEELWKVGWRENWDVCCILHLHPYEEEIHYVMENRWGITAKSKMKGELLETEEISADTHD